MSLAKRIGLGSLIVAATLGAGGLMYSAAQQEAAQTRATQEAYLSTLETMGVAALPYEGVGVMMQRCAPHYDDVFSSTAAENRFREENGMERTDRVMLGETYNVPSEPGYCGHE